MKFTIRETMLVTLVVAVLLGWLVDHWRAAERDAAWEKCFEAAAQHISNFARKGASFETPSGSWRVFSGEENNSEHGK